MRKTRKASCNFKGFTAKSLSRKTKLPKSFDLYDLKYTKPEKKDLAVGLVYFNCVKSKRLLMNYLYTVEKFKIAGIPVFTIEIYKDSPEIKDAIHIKTDFILFQKERLCHILEKHIPDTFTKLLFIDSDLVFDNLNWYNELSKKLDDNNIVQPFSTGLWLDITYKKIVKQRIPIAFYIKIGKLYNEGELGGYHPGFAWAFQRPWFNKVGFFQKAVLGDGDTLSSTAWLNYDFEVRDIYKKSIQEFRDSIKEPPTMCYLEGNIYHLWHGDGKKRHYKERRNIFNSVKDINDIIKMDKNGLYAITDESLKPKIRKYFTNRDDDGLEESVK